MTRKEPDQPRLVPAALAAILSQAAPQSVAAVPLDVQFEPPEVQLQPLCDPRSPDAEIEAAWSDWDGQGFGDRATSLVRRDLRRLATLDADRWDEVILRAMDRLREVDPEYDEMDHVADRIDFLVTTERFRALEAEGLVEQFLDMDIQSSPRALHTAGELLLNGFGIAADEQRAQAFLVQAAYAGNPEALLDLAQMTSDGSTVPGWDVAPELAVTLAFGSLVGDLDARLCDRINRIGSAFRLGEIVAQDLALAERWYTRLSADLGDPNAAWQVAQLHLEAIGLEKDNAGGAGLPRAGGGRGPRLRTDGVGADLRDRPALAPRDIDAARRLYEAAAGAGERDGLVGLAGLVESIEGARAGRISRGGTMRCGGWRKSPMPRPGFSCSWATWFWSKKGLWAGEADAARAVRAGAGVGTRASHGGDAGSRGSDFAMPRRCRSFWHLPRTCKEVVVSVGTAAGMEQFARRLPLPEPGGAPCGSCGLLGPDVCGLGL